MKAIIVDDERRTRKFFCSAIDWPSVGITTVLEAPDGEEAYRIIREEQPAIIMIDMRMPRKDGVELLQLLRELPYPHKTIVVSGFDDYYYLKKTIEYGGFDYFIKPIDETEVTARLKEAVRELEQEKAAAALAHQTAQIVNEQKRLLRDSLMTQWIDSPDQRSDIAAQFMEDWYPRREKAYSLCLCKVNEQAGRMVRLYGQRKDLFYYSLLNVAGELMNFPDQGMGFRYLSSEGTVVLIYYGSGDASVLCRELSRRIFELFGIRIEIAVAAGFAFPDDIGAAYELAALIWEAINQMQPDPDRVYTQATESAGLQSLLQEERELRDLLMSGRNAEDIKQFLRELMARCKDAGSLSNRQILWWEQELRWFRELYVGPDSAVCSERTATEAERETLIYWDDSGSFDLERLIVCLESRLLHLSSEMCLQSGRERKEMVYEIRDYLKRHYHEPLMIRDLSAQFFINSEYASRLFKQEFGIGIKDFVTEIRIKHAKLLLGNPFMKISEIAEKVGFADEKYFSKVFKKETGKTPQQYRKTENVQDETA